MFNALLMKTSAIIQARMGSTRLPGKIMMKIDNENPLLYYIINQLKHSKLLDRIIVATTVLQEDDKVAKYLEENNIDCFRGNSSDVLDRYYKCAKKFSISTIVRITADNPLIDPTIVDKVIEKFYSGSYDFASNCLLGTFPSGTEVEIFSFETLKKAWSNAKTPPEREHVTPFMQNPKIFSIGSLEHSPNLSHLRWTVDRKEDLELVRIIVSRINKRPILMTNIVELIHNEPDLININKI